MVVDGLAVRYLHKSNVIEFNMEGVQSVDSWMTVARMLSYFLILFC